VADRAVHKVMVCSGNGKRIVVVERSKDATESTINVILNWNEELLRLAGSGN
jgi:hypothetical protein